MALAPLRTYPLNNGCRLTYAEVDGYGGSFDPNSQSWTSTIDIDGTQFFTTSPIGTGALQAILGVSYVNGESLSRIVPWLCPYWPGVPLWATKISGVTPMKQIGIDTTGPNGPVVKWDRVRCQVTYNTLPYAVMTDGELQEVGDGSESLRYCERVYKATAEFISIKANFLQYVAPLPRGLTEKTSSFPFGSGFTTVKVDFEICWRNVPDNWLFNGNSLGDAAGSFGIPSNIYNGLGCVNSTAIWGNPAQTLLCLPPSIAPAEELADSTTIGMQAYQPPRVWNVNFKFKQWKQPANQLGAGVTAGHNVGFFPTDTLFYNIGRVNGMVTTPLFKPYDFNLFFQRAA